MHLVQCTGSIVADPTEFEALLHQVYAYALRSSQSFATNRVKSYKMKLIAQTTFDPYMTTHQPQLLYFQVPANEQMQLESHRLAYYQWGDAHAKHLVICVHGLTRQGRDFDVLAQCLLKAYEEKGEPVQVICPDVAGRGRSDWLMNAMSYQVPSYAYGLKNLMDHLSLQVGAKAVDWVGTSMGGLIGMLICGVDAFKLNVPVRRLVLNDVGPVVQWVFIERLKTYLGTGERFEREELGIQKLAEVSKSFGPHTPEQWAALSRPMLKKLSDDEWIFHYDPKIAEPIKQMTVESSKAAEQIMWSIYDQIGCETLLVRGSESDLLKPEDAQLMLSRGPKPAFYGVEGVGHAPTLVQEDQLQRLMEFLV